MTIEPVDRDTAEIIAFEDSKHRQGKRAKTSKCKGNKGQASVVAADTVNERREAKVDNGEIPRRRSEFYQNSGNWDRTRFYESHCIFDPEYHWEKTYPDGTPRPCIVHIVISRIDPDDCEEPDREVPA